jgi:hypothetical protein
MGYKTVNKQNLPMLDYREIEPFQGELKDLTQDNFDKLLASIEKHGFFLPVFVWQSDGHNYCLDGHGRLRVLNKEQIEFDNTGYEIPVVLIEADNVKDAKEKLLKITSQYQHITQEGLDQFIAEAELPEVEIYEAVHFDALSFLDAGNDDEKDKGNKESAPTIRMTFRDSIDLNNALDEIVEMDIGGKYNADIKVIGDE